MIESVLSIRKKILLFICGPAYRQPGFTKIHKPPYSTSTVSPNGGKIKERYDYLG